MGEHTPMAQIMLPRVGLYASETRDLAATAAITPQHALTTTPTGAAIADMRCQWLRIQSARRV